MSEADEIPWSAAAADSGEMFERDLGRLEQIAHDRIVQAKAEHGAEATFLLLSGGNDSMVLLDSVHEHADAVVHINTGIGVPEANAHARRVAASYGTPFLEYRPPVAYEELVLSHPTFDGLPGPGIHHIVYQRLKERCVEQLLREHRSKRGQRFLLLTGVRKAESARRMGLSSPVNRKGGQVWVNHSSSGSTARWTGTARPTPCSAARWPTTSTSPASACAELSLTSAPSGRSGRRSGSSTRPSTPP